MNQLLHRHGFVYKKPKGRPHKADKLRQQDFLEHYELLKKRLKDEDSLYFIDAVHPTQSTKLCNGWIKKGVNKHIDTTA